MTKSGPSPVRPPIDELERLAAEGRYHVVSTVAKSKAGHVGGPLSAMDMLVALYFGVLRIDPAQPKLEARDRFLLSKGHSAIGLYSVMAMRGYFPVEELPTFDKGNSRLQGHPDPTKLPGIEMSSGSLGQGLSVGAGFALASRMRGNDSRSWVMLGDGEIQEGMVWEAAHTAARYQLGHLYAIVDYNRLQQYGWTPTEEDSGDRRNPWSGFDLPQMWRSFGWDVIEFDGHDFESIFAAFDEAMARPQTGKPLALIAHTTKGRGLSFAEGRHTWHTGIANEDELAQARAELGIEGTAA